MEMGGVLAQARTQRILSVSDLASGGAICTAAQLDACDVIIINQTTSTKLVTLPTPSDTTKTYRKTIVNKGTALVWTSYKRVVFPSQSASFTYNPGVGWSADGVGLQVLAQSGASQAYPLDTNANDITLVTIPGGFLGANDGVEPFCILENSSGTSNKNVLLKFGGQTAYANSTALASATANGGIRKNIKNANSVSAQTTMPTPVDGNFGTASPPLALTVNTASDVTVQISVQKGTGADVTTLRAYEVIYHPAP